MHTTKRHKTQCGKDLTATMFTLKQNLKESDQPTQLRSWRPTYVKTFLTPKFFAVTQTQKQKSVIFKCTNPQQILTNSSTQIQQLSASWRQPSNVGCCRNALGKETGSSLRVQGRTKPTSKMTSPALLPCAATPPAGESETQTRCCCSPRDTKGGGAFVHAASSSQEGIRAAIGADWPLWNFSSVVTVRRQRGSILGPRSKTGQHKPPPQTPPKVQPQAQPQALPSSPSSPLACGKAD